jgi:hypothetical protein
MALRSDLLADAVLVLHVAVAAFIAGGLVVIFVGNLLGWRWVNNPWLRTAHLVAMGIVIAEAWLDVACPLTTLEMHLRPITGDPTYQEGFIAYWLQRLLFYEASPWAFVLAYSATGMLVLLAWWRYPPRWKGKEK